MLQRGDRQHDIAAYFGVNGGRIAEVSKGECSWPNAEPLSKELLPPAGPYSTKFAVSSVIATLQETIDAIDMALGEEDVKAALLLAKETLQKRVDSLEEV